MRLVILWLIQDFLTVFSGGGMQIPSIYMLGLIYSLLVEDDKENTAPDMSKLWGIWASFCGGILWDLRWVGIPGFYTVGYVIVVMTVIQVWSMIPPQGRASGNTLIVFMLLEISQLLPPLLPVLILGGSIGWNFFLMQQVYSLPAILITMYIYLRKVRSKV